MAAGARVDTNEHIPTVAIESSQVGRRWMASSSVR